MKALLITLFLFGSAAIAEPSEYYQDFSGEFVSDSGDCRGGRKYNLIYDGEGDGSVTLIRKGEKTPIAVIPQAGATTYKVDSDKKLIITSPHLALDETDENEVRFGEEGGRSIYVDVKTVQLDENLRNEDGEAIYSHTELNLSKDRKTLTYFDSAADFISDPHETVCYFKRVEK